MNTCKLLQLALVQLRTMSKSGPVFYAVKNGRVPGIYRSWSECESQVKGFSKPSFKRFSSLNDAEVFLGVKNTFNQGITSTVQSTSSQEHSLNEYQSPNNDTHTAAVKDSTSIPNVSTTPSFESLSRTVSEMHEAIERIFNVVEGLSSDVCRLQDSVVALESAVFAAPGTYKRDFHTMSPDYQEDGGKKRMKSNSNHPSFTGAIFDEKDAVHVYTDGGCFGNGKVDSKAGIGVFWKHNDPDNVCERLSGRQSNNRAEIFAAVKAVQIAKRKGIQNLILHTDSQFLINGITKWIKGWKKNGWKLSTGFPVINKDDFTTLDNELTGISVKWVYVKGHSGDKANEEADKLAKQGASKES